MILIVKKINKQREMANNYKKNNRDKINIYQNNRRKDLNIRIREHTMSELSHYITRNSYPKRLINALKCDKNTFIKWIEFHFDNNMNWDNYGQYWQFDHIMPCIAFDFTDIVQFNQCNNYINIQPIEKTKNKQKGTYCDSLYLFFHIFKWLLFLKQYGLNGIEEEAERHDDPDRK